MFLLFLLPHLLLTYTFKPFTQQEMHVYPISFSSQERLSFLLNLMLFRRQDEEEELRIIYGVLQMKQEEKEKKEWEAVLLSLKELFLCW